jgi:hypothetical protein
MRRFIPCALECLSKSEFASTAAPHVHLIMVCAAPGVDGRMSRDPWRPIVPIVLAAWWSQPPLARALAD